MNGRIIRPDANAIMLDLPEIGRLHIGKKVRNASGIEHPTSVDYFIPSGKYADYFIDALGEKPQTIQIIFPDDDPEIVCNERMEYRDNAGALAAKGDGVNFDVWNGKKYVKTLISEHPDIVSKVSAKWPKKPKYDGDDGWEVSLTMKFIIPAVSGVVGTWQFTTKGAASSIKNIRNSFDGVQKLRGTVMNTVFDLSVQFAKSNKPGQSSRYPVVSLIANDNRVNDIREMIKPKEDYSNLLLPESK